jgi:hypothetical protein
MGRAPLVSKESASAKTNWEFCLLNAPDSRVKILQAVFIRMQILETSGSTTVSKLF